MRRYFLCAFALCSVVACAAAAQLAACGQLLDQRISTGVDTELAKYYLERSTLAQADRNPLYEAAIRRLHEESDAKTLDWELLKQVTEKTSADVATLYFVRRIQADADNARYQKQFSVEYRCVDGVGECSDSDRLSLGSLYGKYRVLVIGGFHYKSDTSTGADLAGPRALLKTQGFNIELVDIEEDGTVEENAAIIARAVRNEPKQEQLILVSISKGGPETALVLGKLLTPGETRHVRAWVSIGGLLRGTFLADDAIRPGKWWLVKTALFFMGMDSRSVPGMTTVESRKRFECLRFPSHILMVQYVGVPLSGQVSPDVRARYKELLARGPNDGLTLLADELIPGGKVVLDFGMDHYYRDPKIDLKALALANVVVRELSR